MREEVVSRELTREIIVGAFMVMVFLGLGYFTIILSRETWFSQKQPMEVVFKNVMGLRETDSVVVRGMPVGKVDRLDLLKDGVHVYLELDHPLTMRVDYHVTIVATSILGGRYLEIKEGSPSAPILPPDTVLYGTEPYDLMADAAEVVNNVKKALVEGGVIDNLKQASADIRQVTSRLSGGKGMIGRLLSEDDTLYKDLAATVASLRNISERADKGEGTIGKLLSPDDTLYKDFAASAASLRVVSDRLERGEGTLGKLLSPDDKLYLNLSATVSSLRNIAESVERGEGFLGRMVKDDTLYQDIEELVTELRATIDDFRETSPVTTFTSIFFGSF